MISYTKKDIEAMAFIRPEFMKTRKFPNQNVDALVAKAHRERSKYIAGLFAGLIKKSDKAEDAASALHSPKIAVTTGVMDIDGYLLLARKEQAKAIRAQISSAWKWIATKLEARSKKHKAFRQLSAMSRSELADIGLIYGDIEVAVYGAPKTPTLLLSGIANYITTKISGFFSSFKEWQKARAGYADLMSLDDRSLADLGISRGEVYHYSRHGLDTNKANDNRTTTAANDDHRQAV